MEVKKVLNLYIAHQQKKVGLPKPIGIEQHTVDAYKARAGHFLIYFKKNHIKTMEQITHSVCEGLLLHLLSDKKQEMSTANKVIGLLKSLLRHASNRLNVLCNTLGDFKLHYTKKRKLYLTGADLSYLSIYEYDCERLKVVADLAIIQAYTGFSYADLFRFKRDWIHNHQSGQRFIKYVRKKEFNSNAIVPLSPIVVTLMEKYNYQLPTISNQKYNQYLKELADILELDFILTSHVLRKTCGFLLLNTGYSLEFVSKVLGHTSIVTTEKYYTDILEQRLMFELNKTA